MLARVWDFGCSAASFVVINRIALQLNPVFLSAYFRLSLMRFLKTFGKDCFMVILGKLFF
ncbi:MAG: hypothetical protein LBT09_05050 [Planctomycetaceae bacterium]|jgi:hypothetical protein|nr:hypothetical protein [Planctomycetaceae bacterium]